MSKEKEEIFNNITPEQAVQELYKRKTEILNEFAKAYLAESGLLPSQVELVCKETKNTPDQIETIYFFRKKDEQTSMS